jgi:DAK2 domain fusion protein YloV
MQFRKPQIIVSNIPAAARMPQIMEEEVPYGYCTNLLLRGEGLDPDKLRIKLKGRGQSLVVAGDEATVRIHIHTYDPGKILNYVGSLGTMHEISIRNMDEQHEDFLEMQRERMPAVDIAVIAVAPGEGLAEVFKSLGAVVVPGGQTMNPSTKDLLQAVESVMSDKVIVLPNNKNIVLTANQVPQLTRKAIKVVPTETIPQGVSALLAFDYEADLETNTQLMERAKSTIRSIEVTRATRSAQLNGLKIRKKQSIGLLDGKLIAAGDDDISVLNEMLTVLDLGKAEVITIYHGADTESAEAEKVSANIYQRYPQLQVEVVNGGQPHYNFIVSVE